MGRPLAVLLAMALVRLAVAVVVVVALRAMAARPIPGGRRPGRIGACSKRIDAPDEASPRRNGSGKIGWAGRLVMLRWQWMVCNGWPSAGRAHAKLGQMRAGGCACA